MKKHLLSLFIIFSFYGFSQTQKLNLADYKLADYKRHQLDFNYYLNGRNASGSVFDTSRSKQNSFNQDVSVYHSFYKNNRSYQGIQRGQISYNLALNNNSFNNNFRKTRDNNFNLFYSSENRFYNKKQWFVELSPTASFKNTKGTVTENEFDANANKNEVNLALPIALGKGRIERIEDYRMAIFLGEVLSKNNPVAQMPNTQQLLELAAKITQLKNRRFYDFRLQTIYELESLDSLFIKYGLAEGGAAYFTHMYDYWLYANNPIRESGFRATLKAETSYQLVKGSAQLITDTSNISDTFYAEQSYFGPKIELYYAIPFLLNWQFTAVFNTQYYFLINPNSRNRDTPFLENQILAKLGYYPNTRSFINASVGYSNRNNFYSDGTDVRHLITGIIDAYYYISPQVRLNVNYSIQSENIDAGNNAQNRWFQQYSVRFTYMIF